VDLEVNMLGKIRYMVAHAFNMFERIHHGIVFDNSLGKLDILRQESILGDFELRAYQPSHFQYFVLQLLQFLVKSLYRMHIHHRGSSRNLSICYRNDPLPMNRL
jgi:hypothetical protein